MNDQEIIALYFDRNEQAIAETDKSYGKACMQVSMNILQSRPDAEECVSDTYLKTWNAIPPTRPNSLCAFVCRIARNLSLNRLRDLRRDRRNRELTVSFEERRTASPCPTSKVPSWPPCWSPSSVSRARPTACCSWGATGSPVAWRNWPNGRG